MAYSPFLQQMASRYNINLNPRQQENKLLVCRHVLAGLDIWITRQGHEKILPSIKMLENNLKSVRTEFEIMHAQQELLLFHQMKYIKSTKGVYNRCRSAYNHAFSAAQAYNNKDYPLASATIDQCHDEIKKALGEILISRPTKRR